MKKILFAALLSVIGIAGADELTVSQPYASVEAFSSKDSDEVHINSALFGIGSYVGNSDVDRFGIKYGPVRFSSNDRYFNGKFWDNDGNVVFAKVKRKDQSVEGDLRIFDWAKEYGKYTLEGSMGTMRIDGQYKSVGHLQWSGPVPWFSNTAFEARYERSAFAIFYQKYGEAEGALVTNPTGQPGITCSAEFPCGYAGGAPTFKVLTMDTAYLSVDKEFDDRWAGSVMVGQSDISDGNHRFFTRSKLSYYLLPDYGVSTYGKVRTVNNSKENNGYYYSPAHMIEGVVGLQYRKFFREQGSVFTATVEAGRQNSDTASNDVYGAELKYESYLNKRTKWNFVVGHRVSAGGRAQEPDYKNDYIMMSIVIPF